MRVHRRRLVDAEIRLIQRDPFFLGLFEIAAPLRVVDAELVLLGALIWKHLSTLTAQDVKAYREQVLGKD